MRTFVTFLMPKFTFIKECFSKMLFYKNHIFLLLLQDYSNSPTKKNSFSIIMLQHIKDKEFRLLLSGEELLAHIKRLARQISDDYEGKTPLILPVLNGAFMFAADLIKHITVPCEVSFIKLASYYGMESSGEVEEILGLNKTIQDRHVIVLEDIIDSGLTMASVLRSLKVYNPSSVELATMLFKPDAFKGKFDIKYIGTAIPNRFVVGYGLDYDELGRNLPDLYELNEPK